MENYDSLPGRKKWSKAVRYACAMALIGCMVGAADFLGEKEVIFPEAVALTVGLWIIDKRVWKAGRMQVIALMTAGALAGISIVRYSPLPLILDLFLAFAFAAVCLTITRTTLVPLISACMLPVLLGTESLVYPATVFCLILILAGGQWLMEKAGLRKPIPFRRAEKPFKQRIRRWGLLAGLLLAVSFLPIHLNKIYCIVPPLIVTLVEFANPEAGFRKTPGRVLFQLAAAAVLGTGSRLLLQEGFGFPTVIAVWVVCGLLFFLFERMERSFAPAGALALVPFILPNEGLILFTVQAVVGAVIIIFLTLNVLRSEAEKTATAETKIPGRKTVFRRPETL